MSNTKRLQKYVFENYTYVTNSENFNDAVQYAGGY